MNISAIGKQFWRVQSRHRQANRFAKDLHTGIGFLGRLDPSSAWVIPSRFHPVTLNDWPQRQLILFPILFFVPWTERRMYTSSSFYSAFHPSMEEQVELARQISHSLSADTNSTSKGQSMYVKRRNRSSKWIHEGIFIEPSISSLVFWLRLFPFLYCMLPILYVLFRPLSEKNWSMPIDGHNRNAVDKVGTRCWRIDTTDDFPNVQGKSTTVRYFNGIHFSNRRLWIGKGFG